MTSVVSGRFELTDAEWLLLEPLLPADPPVNKLKQFRAVATRFDKRDTCISPQSISPR